MADLYSLNQPTILSSEVQNEVMQPFESSEEIIEVVEISSEILENSSSNVIYMDEDILTNETFLDGINQLIDTIDPLSVNEEVIFQDYPSIFFNRLDLPDYSVIYEVNGYEVVFPTSYADNVCVRDGMLVNLGDSYVAGVKMDGYSVNNYLSSEITIPTFHSSTWYQYLQTYGQPYRIVDRYVNTNGNISSTTRASVNVEWSGGNLWEGFTFNRISIFIILILVSFIFLFRKGR